jgi:hypothetical protein
VIPKFASPIVCWKNVKSEMRHNVLIGEPEVKSPLGRLGHRWKNVISVDHRETALVRCPESAASWTEVHCGPLRQLLNFRVATEGGEIS